MARILAVEDDDAIRLVLRHHLTRAGFELAEVGTAEGGLAALEKGGVDLVLLDVMLPRMDGWQALRALRGRGDDVPVVVLSALGEEEDRVTGFETGCDDYVVKPFSARELVLRVEAILSRRGGARLPSVVVWGGFVLDRGRMEVTFGGEPLDLTKSELGLLRVLLENAPNAVSREALLRDGVGWEEGAKSRAVDSHMSRLRRKLGVASTAIESVGGFGYRLATPD